MTMLETDDPQELLVAVLRNARGHIDKPEKWCKGAAALDKRETSVRPESPNACQFCFQGAVIRAVRALPEADTDRQRQVKLEVYDCFTEAAQELGLSTLGDPCPSDFNDHPDTTHEQMLAAIDLAIANAEAHL